jgi:hypothetical protein
MVPQICIGDDETGFRLRECHAARLLQIENFVEMVVAQVHPRRCNRLEFLVG